MAMNRIDIMPLGRRVAAHEDAALWSLPRPSTSERLAAVRGRQAMAARHASRFAAWSRGGLALAACAAVLFLLVSTRHHPGDPGSPRIELAPGGVGATAAADVPPVSTAGCGGTEGSGWTPGNAGSGG